MLFIFGISPAFDDLGMAEAVCRICGRLAPQRVARRRQRFTLFFVLPVFSFGTRYLLSCSACGASDELDKSQAQRAGIA